jgi:AraC-like DNA-binding protein
MIFYKKYLPIPALRAHINCFYILEYRAGNAVKELPTFANNNCAMVFNYGDRYRLSNLFHKDELLPRNFFSVTSTAPYKISLTGNIGTLGVIFRSMAFKSLFRLPSDLSVYLDKRIDAEPFTAGIDAERFTDALFEAPSPEQKIQLANQYFLKLFKPKLQELSLADLAVQSIMEARGFISMDELAAKCFITTRHLRRIFRESTGVSPKYYARIKRFGYTMYNLNSPNFKLQTFIRENGFYDQSHIISEFRTFSGRTPVTLGLQQIMQEFSEV